MKEAAPSDVDVKSKLNPPLEVKFVCVPRNTMAAPYDAPEVIETCPVIL